MPTAKNRLCATANSSSTHKRPNSKSCHSDPEFVEGEEPPHFAFVFVVVCLSLLLLPVLLFVIPQRSGGICFLYSTRHPVFHLPLTPRPFCTHRIKYGQETTRQLRLTPHTHTLRSMGYRRTRPRLRMRAPARQRLHRSHPPS